MFKHLEYYGKPSNRINLSRGSRNLRAHLPRPGGAAIWYTWEQQRDQFWYFVLEEPMEAWLKEHQVDYSLEVKTKYPGQVCHVPRALTPMGLVLKQGDLIEDWCLSIPNTHDAIQFKLVFGGT